jgi:hypothetical protein
MPYRTFAQRVAKYSKAVIPANVAAKFTAELTDMIAGQQAQQSLIVAMEESIRSYLDGLGVVGNLRIPYLNFGRTLFKTKGSTAGIALQKKATAEKAKWVSLGFDATILEKVVALVIGWPSY